MTKQQAISLVILKKIADGMTAAEAMDAVFGPGTFDRLASDIYDKMNEQSAAYQSQLTK